MTRKRSVNLATLESVIKKCLKRDGWKKVPSDLKKEIREIDRLSKIHENDHA